MASESKSGEETAAAEAVERQRREKLARMAERFDEVERRLTELEGRLEKAEEEFRPNKPR